MGISRLFEDGMNVFKDREGNYGDARPMFEAIAKLWNSFLNVIMDNSKPDIITASDVAVMLALFKIARAKGMGGKYTHDTGVDVINYAALWADMEERTAEEFPPFVDTDDTLEMFEVDGDPLENDALIDALLSLKDKKVWDKDRFESKE